MPRLHITIQPADDGDMANGEIVSFRLRAEKAKLDNLKFGTIAYIQKRCEELGIANETPQEIEV